MSHRTPRMAEAIREVVSNAILFEVADPRVRGVTVLRVEVTGDHRNATVFVSVMGPQAEQQSAMKGLKSAAGFVQSRVAARLQTRYTPVLAFKLDESVKKSVEMSRLIEETLAADRENSPQGQAPGAGERGDVPIDTDDDGDDDSSLTDENEDANKNGDDGGTT